MQVASPYLKPRAQCPQVILPTVPLGIETSVTFYVINHGYDNLDLR